jgi:hypothetical protein
MRFCSAPNAGTLFAGAREVFAERVHRFDAPRPVIFDALTFNHEDQAGHAQWLELQPGETRPHVIEFVRDEQVVWSSLWPVSPDDTIRFDLTDDDRGERQRCGSGGSASHRTASSRPILGYVVHRLLSRTT